MSSILLKHYIKRNIQNARRSKTTSTSYQYIKQSIIPTMHFQNSLPRLPIPKLEATCKRYLAAQLPLLSEEEFRKTEHYVNHFKNSIGKSVQEILVKQDKQNKKTSYISKPWFDMYLASRDPIPINVNPVLVFQNDAKVEYNKQSVRATNFITSALRFYRSLRENVLEPEVFHLQPAKTDNEKFRKICAKTPKFCSWFTAYLHNAYPLDMSQYNNLFNTSRIPEIGKDRIYSKDSRHILLQYKGHFYAFDVLDENGYILEPEQILSGIETILNENVQECEFPIGILTTLNRDSWANLRQSLIQLGNENVLEVIDSALFNICLDDVVLGDDKYKLVRSFLHGDGKNRWFDKSISLLLSKDGYAGINFEHSWGDGVAVLRFFQDILKDSTEQPQVHPNNIPNSTINVRKLDITLDDHLKSSVKRAIHDYDKTCNDLDINFIESDGLGKVFCKKHQISPDAVMQMCFQSAYHKQFNKFVASYESCSTAAFKHGRTETIRPNTMATKNYCLAVNSMNRKSNSELRNMIKECSNIHSQLTKEAAMGQGFDRHLFALKLIIEQMNIKDADIFKDEAYYKMNYNILSTSTLSSPSVLAGGFGPVVQDGYGVGYVIRDNSMGTLVTSYPGLDGKEFINCLKESIDEVIKILSA